MPASRTVEVKAAGLFTHPNKLKLPPGALRIAENCSIARDGITSRRRGFNRYGDELSAPALELFEYLGRLIVLDGTSLKYDSDQEGTWVAWTGSFSAPSSDVRMQALESNLNFYFLTSLGPYVQDSLTGTPRRAGIPQGLDMQLTATGVGGSWLVPPTTVGYVLTWKRKDANANEKQGSPSTQERISNSLTASLAWTRVTTTATVTHTAHGFTTGDIVIVSDSSDTAAIVNGEKTITVTGVDTYTFTCLNAGAASGTLSDGKAFDVAFTATVPDDVIVGDTWELWRTDLTAAAGDPVGADYRLIMSGELTTAQKTAGVITGTDTFDETFLGEPLYTNGGEEGPSQANDRPPLARFIFQFDTHTNYAHTIHPHRLEGQLIEVAGLVDSTSSITFTQGSTSLTYTFAAAENQVAREFKRWTSFLTLAENVEATAKSLVKIINRDTGNTLFNAYYISGELDAPGKFLIEAKVLGADAITLTCNNSTTSVKFSPIIPTSGVSYISDNQESQNRVYRSKSGQPEAVPRLNFHELGRKNKEIKGALALNKAALVWKEDGLFAISGSSDGSSGAQFVVEEVDPTAHLTVPSSLRLLNNTAVGFTQQGVLQAGQGQPAILSRPQVEADLLKISKFQQFEALAHAANYESEHKYILFVPETASDDTVTVAYVYDYSQNAWVTWRKAIRAARVLEEDDKLYMAHALDSYVLQERKSLDGSGNDFIDEEIPATITAVTTTTHPVTGRTVSLVTLTYDYREELAAGFILIQGSKRGPIDVVTDLGGNSFQVTCRFRYNFTVAAATVGLPIPMTVEWAPITLGDGLSMKQFSVCTVALERSGGTHELSFQSDIIQSREAVDTFYQQSSKGWGIGGWGTMPWGDPAPGRNDALRTWVPRDHQQCRALSVRYVNRYAKEKIDLLQLSLDVRPFSTQSQRTPT